MSAPFAIEKLGNGIVAVKRSQMQRRGLTWFDLHLDTSSTSDEQLDNRRVAATRGEKQRRLTCACSYIHIDALGDKQFGHFLMPILGRSVKGAKAVFFGCIDFGSFSNEQSHNVRMPVGRRDQQRSPIIPDY